MILAPTIFSGSYLYSKLTPLPSLLHPTKLTTYAIYPFENFQMIGKLFRKFHNKFVNIRAQIRYPQKQTRAKRSLTCSIATLYDVRKDKTLHLPHFILLL